MSSARPARIVDEQRIQTICLLLISVVAVGVTLYWLSTVMVPFVLALFIAISLSSLSDFGVQRLRIPRFIAMSVTILFSALLFASMGLLVSAAVGELAANASAYTTKLSTLVAELSARIPETSFALFDIEATVESLSKIPVRSVGSLLAATTSAVVDVLSRSTLVLIFVAFLLLGGEGARQKPNGTWTEIQVQVARYFVTKVALSGITGLLVGVTLQLLGVPLALVFGLFAFLLNFIPSIGSIFATLLPLPIVLATPDLSPTVAVAAIAGPGTIQIVIGNVIEPKVMGDSLGLHPVTVLLSLITWGTLWGIPGMLLATPITAAIKILCERLEPTRAISELMAGRLR